MQQRALVCLVELERRVLTVRSQTTYILNNGVFIKLCEVFCQRSNGLSCFQICRKVINKENSVTLTHIVPRLNAF